MSDDDKPIEGEFVERKEQALATGSGHSLEHVSITSAMVEKVRWNKIEEAITAHNRAGQAQVRSNEILSELKESEVLLQYSMKRAEEAQALVDHEIKMDASKRDADHQNFTEEQRQVSLERKLATIELEEQILQAELRMDKLKEPNSGAQAKGHDVDVTALIKEAYENAQAILNEAKENGTYSQAMQQSQDKILEYTIQKILTGDA